MLKENIEAFLSFFSDYIQQQQQKKTIHPHQLVFAFE